MHYRDSGDNRVLRHVLVEAWNRQCYWCRRLKDYTDLQVDHIVPKSASKDERSRTIAQLGLADDYDVDDVNNLAPICGPCNIDKGDTNFTETGKTLSDLKKARRLAPDVSRQVSAFYQQTDVGGALLTLMQADIDDVSVRAAFTNGAAAVVQRFADLGLAADTAEFRSVDVPVPQGVFAYNRGETLSVVLRLMEAGRAAVMVLEEVSGGDLAEALESPFSELFDKIRGEAANAHGRYDEILGYPTVEPGEVAWPDFVIDEVTFTAEPHAQLDFTFEGDFSARVTSSVVGDTPNGDGLQTLQGEALISGRFAFSLAWDPARPPGSYIFDSCWLPESRVDEAWLEGKQT